MTDVNAPLDDRPPPAELEGRRPLGVLDRIASVDPLESLQPERTRVTGATGGFVRPITAPGVLEGHFEVDSADDEEGEPQSGGLNDDEDETAEFNDETSSTTMSECGG